MKFIDSIRLENLKTFFLFLFVLQVFLPNTGLTNDLQQYGFFYHPETQRYFSNGKASFSIRAVNNKSYLKRIEVSIDGESFKEYDGTLSFAQEGLHHIRFRATDPVLNWSPVQTFRVYVDTLAPKSEPIWQGTTYEKDGITYAAPSSRLALNVQDNLSGVSKVIWDQGGKVTTFPNNASFKKEGEYTVRFAAVDNVGNKEEWRDYRFRVDGTSPSSTAEIQGFSHKNGSNLYVSSGSQIVLKGQDENSGVDRIEYQINDGPLTDYKQALAIWEKTFELKFRAVDHVGNREKWNVVTVHQDISPPRISLQRNGSSLEHRGKIYAQPGFTLRTAVQDSESGLKSVLATRDGDQLSEVKSPEFKFVEPREYKFVLRAVDHVGNMSEENPSTIVIDNQAPKSTLTSTDDLVPNGDVLLSAIPNKLEITAEDTGVGVEKIEVSYDGKTFRTLTSSIDLAEWKETQRTLYFRSVDRLGNREAPQKVTINVRTKAPTLDLFVEANNLPNLPLSEIKRGASDSPSTRKSVRTPAAEKKSHSKSVEKNRKPKKTDKRRARKRARKK